MSKNSSSSPTKSKNVSPLQRPTQTVSPKSLLAKAFRGELVPQDTDDEPASVLLERIKKEGAELIREEDAEKKIKNPARFQLSDTMRKITDIPDIDRPREKLIRKGASSLSNVELLAVLIGKGFPGRDVLQVASEIDRRFKDDLDKIGFEELIKIEGIGETKASQILASFELARRYFGKNDVKITFPADVLPFVMEIRDKNQEYFVCISLNGANEVIGNRVVTVGLLNANQVHPREIFSDAIAERAASIILVHNHPSGNTEPSHADIAVTKRLIEAGEILGIRIHDHIIVSRDGHTSMKEKGLI
jgi:DNA repair protein RadC